MRLVTLRLSAICLLRHDLGSVHQIVRIVSELIADLTLDNGICHLLGSFHLVVAGLRDDLHDGRSGRWEPKEDLVADFLGHLLNVEMHIRQAVGSRVRKQLQLWPHQIMEHIDRREAWKLVTLMQLYRLVNVMVRIVLSRLEVSSVLNVELLKELLDLCSALHLLDRGLGL